MWPSTNVFFFFYSFSLKKQENWRKVKRPWSKSTERERDEQSEAQSPGSRGEAGRCCLRGETGWRPRQPPRTDTAVTVRRQVSPDSRGGDIPKKV